MKLLSTRTGCGLGVRSQLAITLIAASWTLTSLQAAEPIPLRAGPVSMVLGGFKQRYQIRHRIQAHRDHLEPLGPRGWAQDLGVLSPATA